jgi:hypothetical protein
MPSIINSDDGVVSGTSGLKTTGGNDGVLNIQTNGTNAISISSGQRSTFPTTIGVGGATPSTSGVGISFPATFSGSSDANTLDDYEEGTWTPAVSFGNGTNGITYTTQSGGYIKIGAQVTVWAQVVLSSKGSSAGSARITNLPFTNANAPGRSEGASVVFNFWANFSGTPIPLGYVQNNATTILISNGIATNSISSLADTNFTNTSNFYFNGTYSTV